ncbi:MAG: polysaccharide biosynthesis/export family protein [Hyphomicrobiaceae bacterium]
MQSRSMQLTLCFVSSLFLAGCAHVDERWSDAGNVQVAAEPPGARGHAYHAWSEPTVVPVGLSGPRAVADTDGPYLLDSGDKLRIFVYGQPNLSRVYTVDHDGWITVPLIGAVKARGITTFDLEHSIKRKLGSQYVKDPHVTVDMQQNRPFFILGEVRNGGQYPYVSGMTVKTAVAIAGGFSERAEEGRVEITRRVNGVIERLEVPDDYVVKPGDTLKVYERFF